MKILITGASGFIGLNLLECFLGAGHDVWAIAADQIPTLARDEFSRLPGRFHEMQADVRDRVAMEKAVRDAAPQVIIAAAAITAGTARELASPGDILEVNLVATLRMVELAARYTVPRVVCFSSTAAMGELPFLGQPVAETKAPQPITHYGISKAAIEASAERWNAIASGPRVYVARLSAVFGPWERDSGVRDTLSPLHWMVRQSIAARPIGPLPVGGERDWAYAPYVAEVVQWLATATTPEHIVYNVGPGAVWHPRLLIAALAEVGIQITESPTAEPIPFNDDVTRRRAPLDASRISAAFRTPPEPAAALGRFARWVAGHREWYRA